MENRSDIEPGFRWNRDPVVLLVDDEPGTLSAVRRTLRNEPYEVITDPKMPPMSGTELLDLVRKRYPRTARALLTGYPPAVHRRGHVPPQALGRWATGGGRPPPPGESIRLGGEG